MCSLVIISVYERVCSDLSVGTCVHKCMSVCDKQICLFMSVLIERYACLLLVSVFVNIMSVGLLVSACGIVSVFTCATYNLHGAVVFTQR